MHHTVPLDHWPPVPLRERRPARRRSSVEMVAEFTSPGASWRGVGRGTTVSDALHDAWSSLPTPGEWRLARFFPAESAGAA